MAWVIEPFDRRHDRSAFDCGQPLLNDFIQRYATQYERRRVGRTYVLIESGQTPVAGYYTLAAGELRLDDLTDEDAKKLPRHPVPIVVLARLAVDRALYGQKLGAMLLRDALARSVAAGTVIGAYAVFVDAIDESAVRFYSRYGFIPIKSRADKLYLRLETVAATTA